MFHSVIQYSLINWGRASKNLLHNVKNFAKSIFTR